MWETLAAINLLFGDGLYQKKNKKKCDVGGWFIIGFTTLIA